MDWYRHENKRQVRINRQGEMVFLTFPILERQEWVNHLFTTRMGGVSEGIYSSMNLSYTRGDRKEAVDENYRRVADALHCCVEDIVCSDQTHTTNLRVVGRADGGKGIIRRRNYTDVDGLLTDEPGVYLAAFFADCVPLYFVDTKRKAIALAHSGWRGTVARMGQCVVEKMRQTYGTDPADLVAAVGPSICQDCYEVSEDVIDQFRESFRKEILPELFYRKDNGKYQLNLWRANEEVLKEAGVKKERIAVTNVCTHCNPDILFSHRTMGNKRGNLSAFLALKR